MDIHEYKKSVIQTTDRVQIIMMLYDGAVNYLRLARQDIENGDIMSKGARISKVTTIITELSNALDMEKGGEISKNLRSIYDFVLRRLIHANLKNDIKAIDEAQEVISIIRDGWREMMNRMRQPAGAGV